MFVIIAVFFCNEEFTQKYNYYLSKASAIDVNDRVVKIIFIL